MSQMQVARLVEIGKPFEVGTAPNPEPTGHDVLVQAEACCLVPKSHNLVTNGSADFLSLPVLPCIFGLDAAGTVDVGEIDLCFLQHEFVPLAEVNEAFNGITERLGGAVNVVVQSSVDDHILLERKTRRVPA